MLLSSYTYSSGPVPTTTTHAPPASPRSFAQAREAAARRHGHTYKRKYVEIALRIAGAAGGGVRPAYSRAFPPLLSGVLRTVEDVVEWLASPNRPPGIDPAEGKLGPRRARRKRQQVANLLLACQACLRPLLDRRREGGDGATGPEKNIRVVEFCCGTGHVGLPLALLYPSIRVLLLDVSPAAIAIARARVAAAGLADRVACRVGTVEDFLLLQQQQQSQSQPPPQPIVDHGGFGSGFHLGIALHACGPATDLSLEAALRARAAFVLCPCCVGKIQHAPPSLAYPRSRRVRRALSLLPPSDAVGHDKDDDEGEKEEERRRLRADYAVLASAADVSVRSFAAGAAGSGRPGAEAEGRGDDDSDSDEEEEEEGGGVQQPQQEQQEQEQEQEHRQRQRQRRLCKSIVETDRCLRAAERGYRTQLMLLTPRECTPKNDLLFGWPESWEGEGEGDDEGDGDGEEAVVVPLLESGGPLGAEAAAFDAWFGDGVDGDDGDDKEGGEEEEGSGVVESH